MLVFSCRTSWRLQRVESRPRLLRRSRPALLCTLSTCSKEGTKWHHIATIAQTNGHQRWLTTSGPGQHLKPWFLLTAGWCDFDLLLITFFATLVNLWLSSLTTHYCNCPSILHSESFFLETARWDQRLSQHSAIKKACLAAILTVLSCVWLTAWK